MTRWAIFAIGWALGAAGVSIGVASDIAAGYFGEPVTSSPADWEQFKTGLRQFSRVWEPADGAGKLFNERSCMACHSVPMPGGAGLVSNSFVLLSTHVQDDAGGHVVQRRNRSGAQVEHRQESAATQRRKAPALFGVGLLERVPDHELLQAIAGIDEIRGRAGGRAGRIGRFGWKAGFSDLEDFTRAAFAVELGFGRKPFAPLQYPELAQAISEVTQFIRGLGPPPTRAGGPAAAEGRLLFQKIGCAQCHRPSMVIAPGEHFAPYTDLLLHDMGVRLADGIRDGNAGEREFRTPPLWGVGSSGPPYLHDGRAGTLQQAIDEHGGAALNTQRRWRTLSDQQRSQLLIFLHAL